MPLHTYAELHKGMSEPFHTQSVLYLHFKVLHLVVDGLVDICLFNSKNYRTFFCCPSFKLLHTVENSKKKDYNKNSHFHGNFHLENVSPTVTYIERMRSLCLART